MDTRQRTPLDLARALVRWPVESQLGSRRNALTASTRLTQTARERRDVEEFLERLHGRPPHGGADPVAEPVAGPDEPAGPWSGERHVI
jgi:hypothetical protein